MPDTSFSSQCPWCILDTGTTRQFLYALFPGPEHAVCRHQPQCDALPRACFFVTWHINTNMNPCWNLHGTVLHRTELDGKLGAHLRKAQCGLGDNAGDLVLNPAKASHCPCKLSAQAKYQSTVSQADLEAAGEAQQCWHGASHHQQKWQTKSVIYSGSISM